MFALFIYALPVYSLLFIPHLGPFALHRRRKVFNLGLSFVVPGALPAASPQVFNLGRSLGSGAPKPRGPRCDEGFLLGTFALGPIYTSKGGIKTPNLWDPGTGSES